MAEAAAAGSTTLLPALPDEIVIWEILVRLPPTSLLRCRAVCRIWRRATSAHDFLVAHHTRQPTLPLLHGCNCVDDVIESLDIIPFDNTAGVDAADQLQSISRLCGIDTFVIEKSCDGLLILSLSWGRFSICNPATRQYAPLQQIHGLAVLGFYLHGPTGEYRLLLYRSPRMMHDGLAPDSDTDGGVYVFTLGSSQPQRHIGFPEARQMKYNPRSMSILFSGRLHWYIGDMIMVFDTIAESFRQMRSPIVSDYAHLFEMGDMLGLYKHNDKDTSIEIWVMQNYEGEVWKLKCMVELPVEEIKAQFGMFDYYWKEVAMSWDGDVFVLVNFDDCLLQVDMDGHLVDSFHHKGLGPTRLRLKQTLVSHAFFPTLEGYVVNELPFISSDNKVVNTDSLTSEGC